MGRFGSGDEKSYIFGPETRNYRGRSEAGAQEQSGGRPPCKLHPKTWRRCLPTGRDGSCFGRRRCGFRGSAKQRRNVSLVRLGSCRLQTGRRRALQVDQAIACIDFAQVTGDPVTPSVVVSTPVLRERLFSCEYFELWRLRGELPFMVGAAGMARVLVCIAGTGQLEHNGVNYAVGKGDTLLLPAVAGVCAFRPHGAVSLFEIALPE